jgi:hypothetical protein
MTAIRPCVPSTPYIAKPVLNPRDAIASHVRWKITLLFATQMREPLTPRALHAIQNPDECSAGIWLLSAQTFHLRATPEYRAVRDLHYAFHAQMKQIAGLIQAGDYVQAERILNAPEPFQSVSNSFANALMALDRIPPGPLVS